VLKQTSYTQKYPSLSVTYIVIFAIGLACMAVAGYFLIEGLSQFSGTEAAKRMLIVGGILFQVTESICFISASALTYHSLTWRYTLFVLGIILFSFSIGVMTLAQKAALQTGEAQAQASDEKRDYLRNQLISLDKAIASYRFNAEKQSQSIYKDSRALGQDSLNRAIVLEDKKRSLSEELFTLNESRKQTSSDFFTRVEAITGLPAKSTEIYFLLTRSLLLELSGIILMSFGANLRAYKQLVADVTENKLDKPKNKSPDNASPAVKAPAPIADDTKTAAVKNTQSDIPKLKTQIDPPITTVETGLIMETPAEDEAYNSDIPLTYLSTMVMDLYEQKLISDLEEETIQKGLNEHCKQSVNREIAAMLSRILLNRQEEYC